VDLEPGSAHSVLALFNPAGLMTAQQLNSTLFVALWSTVG